VHPEEKLAALGLQLPLPQQPLGRYLPAVQTGKLLFVAGHLPERDGELQYVGKVGRDWNVEQGHAAARLVALAMLATVKASVGDLGRVRRVVKLLGMVNCTEDYTHPGAVINGASELFYELWGEAGMGTRSAVGLQQLPGGVAVEIEAIFEIAD
jgi:enamine deaminase RidA (YjgF/YER057c/UK114 family)